MSRTHASVRRALAPAAAVLFPVAMSFSSAGTYRGYVGADGKPSVAIFR